MLARAIYRLSSLFLRLLGFCFGGGRRLCPKGGDPGRLDFLFRSGLVALNHPQGDGILWANHKVSLPVEPGFGAVFGIDPWRQGRGRQILVLDAGFRFEAYCVILAWPG